MSQRIADGIGQLGELEDYHYSFVQDGKVTLVGRKFVAQPAHNWGHRVAFAGTYVLTFDKQHGAWERHNFAELVNDENVDEALFVREGKLYLLTFTNFGAIEFKKLFRWENNTFVELTLSAPSARSLHEQHRTQVLPASGRTSKGESVLLVNDDDGAINIFSLTANGNAATIEKSFTVSQEENPLRGQPVIGEVHDDKLLISYGVHGCGFRWESCRFIVVDLTTGVARQVQVEADYSVLPKFGFTGPNVSFVNKSTNSWIVAAGSIQQGMCGSSHYGAVWALKDIFQDNSKPVWVEQSQTVGEGDHVIDGLTLYTITKDAVSEIQLDNA